LTATVDNPHNSDVPAPGQLMREVHMQLVNSKKKIAELISHRQELFMSGKVSREEYLREAEKILDSLTMDDASDQA
jgi:hypothetical protein